MYNFVTKWLTNKKNYAILTKRGLEQTKWKGKILEKLPKLYPVDSIGLGDLLNY